MLHLFGECSDDLYPGGTGPNEPDPLADVRHRMIPACGVKAGSGETLQSFDFREARQMQHSGGAHHDIGDIATAVGKF
ncbi:Uncharacterised protein [Mycobacteroides abscessus subsp. abscessus]|nr:Uncharacterised protein [Mycobacteroides abscessus subsp. abscessus]